MYKILVADDEIKIRNTIKDYLTAKGLNVTTACDGEDAVEKTEETEFDLIIIDVMMPKKDGLKACEEIRKYSNVPILFLSALGEETDYLKGFSSGGDDYIVKPVPLSVLHQKCLSMITMSKGTTRRDEISLNGIVIDLAKRKVFVENTEITLTTKDYELLRYLMENKNIVLDREKILNRIWGWEYEGTSRVVDTHIKRIRKALGEKAVCIKTVVNVGYTFECWMQNAECRIKEEFLWKRDCLTVRGSF